ncbi:hypothetical protein [Clostridium sp. Ade.TY]|uniref:hypothetical protein n=1 Tax=Clostridium sp. Ade.TY TaxID=1391647 RepID=UPI000405F80F|nr:hypothetical protein [Clostridium sp. Ade.TY]
MFNKNILNSVTDLSVIESTSILSNRVFDYIDLESSNVTIKNDANFNIISSPPQNTNYKIGESLCINNFKLEYDSIAALFTPESKILLGYFVLSKKRVYPIAVPELIVSKSTDFILNPDESCTGIGSIPFGISNNFEFNVDCDHLSEISSLIEQNIIFGITGLKITVSGTTNLLPFTATYEPGTRFICYALNQPYTFDFFCNIKIPNYKNVTLRQTFNPSLYIRGINTDNSKIKLNKSIYSFKADIESLFIFKKTITTLIEEPISLLNILY